MNVAISRPELPMSWLRVAATALFVLLLAILVVPDRALAPETAPLQVRLTPVADAGGRTATTSRDGSALLLGTAEQTRHGEAELRFTLPPVRDQNAPRWVIWLRRMPVDGLTMRVDGAWNDGERSFLEPRPDEGPMPVGYQFRLPASWEGEVRVRMAATAIRETVLQPLVITEETADVYAQRATILATLAYACLATLALVTLTLYFASHDEGFLSFFLFCTAGILLLAVSNGHLYLLNSFGVFRMLGSAGTHVASLVFEAATLRIMLLYADGEQRRPDLKWLVDNASVALLAVAGVLLAWREQLDPIASWAIPLLWLGGIVLGFALMLEARRRRVPMAIPVTLSIVAMLVAMVTAELTVRGALSSSLWTLYGYQLAIMACALTLGVGLISRISKYREQRDREQRARADSERRMYREAVRTELLTALQTSLRNAGEEDIQPLVFRHLLDHLRRVVPIANAVAMARGYHGRDTLVVQPAAYLEEIEAELDQRLQTLRRQLGGAIEMQRPITRSGGETPVAIEAVVALPLRPPAWGLIVLERNGATVFHPEELIVVRELARLALLQADEAYNALQLRYTAEVDALTGALNRRSLDQALSRTFQEAHRRRQPLSVLFVDLDRFKTVNDEYGHACGDHCLREVARIVSEQIGEDDVFGRYGGEEFLVILPGRQTEMARAIAEQIREAIERERIEFQGWALQLTASIGIAGNQGHDAAHQATVERADKALYAAKHAGRNRVNVAPAVFVPQSASA